MSDRPVNIFLAEDNDADVYLIREALIAQGTPFQLQVVGDGAEALAVLEKITKDDKNAPQLIIFDLNLPKKSGMEVLRHIRVAGLCGWCPIIILTSSDSPKDQEEALRLGAKAYFEKPFSFDEFMKLGSKILEVCRKE